MHHVLHEVQDEDCKSWLCSGQSCKNDVAEARDLFLVVSTRIVQPHLSVGLGEMNVS